MNDKHNNYWAKITFGSFMVVVFTVHFGYWRSAAVFALLCVLTALWEIEEQVRGKNT